MAIWLLWKRRNQMVFRNQGLNPHLAKEIIQRAFEYAFCAAPTKVPMRRVVTHVRWSKPNAGWMKLNTDGSSLGNPGLARGGGLIRNEEGRRVAGFARKIGITSSFLAGLWALRDGLSLCVSRGFAAVEVELDAKSIVDAISNPEYSNILASSLMDDCRHMVKQVPRIQFKHCFREANRCADALARMGGFLDVDFTVFESLAVEVELDAKSIVDAISNPEYSNILASSLMDDCRHMVKQVPRIQFKHCFREANRCADALARMGGFLDVDFTVFESPPVDISSFLDFDCNGLFLSRLCPATLFSA
ncbi:uncharacterized protein LOC136062392 [Quercus suber]|uniref:uncharacterized protein LOC136062392 n=1 Tax=Quercus suber TaxID=58331 RepID=UPI0032DF5A8E